MERIQAAIEKAKRLRGIARGEPIAAMPVARKPESADLWARLPKVSLETGRMDANRIVTFSQKDPSHFVFDTIRAKLLRTLRQNGWKTIGITSPSQQNGKTMLSLNLAMSLSHLSECRVVLCDMDLRKPKLAETLGLDVETSIELFLRGQKPIEKVFKAYGSRLAFGLCGHPAEAPAELLQSETTRAAMLDIKNGLEPDVVLVDLPPMLVTDDVLSLVPNLDGVFLIAAAETTTLDEIETCTRDLAEQTNVLGVILNKCAYPGKANAYYGGYY